MNQVEIPRPPTPAGSPHEREVEEALYAKRQKIYPREVHGLFAGLRIAAVVALLGIFYGLPWLPWDGRQATLPENTYRDG